MKKVIFTTSMIRSGSGMLVSVDEDNNFHDPVFVSVNHVAGSSTYATYCDGSSKSNGRSFTSAEDAWWDAQELYGASEIYPVPMKWLKKEFGKSYTEPLARFKEGLSEAKMKEREAKKLAEESKKKSPSLRWRKSSSGYWNA
ncbi:hypothetical protein [Vibrio phage vB_VibM_10AMN]|uniref:Uncharacterized protein n=1 Tax=Staphylococcus phage vB_VibM_10AMN12 TaxID=3076785 RepID=A0AA96QZB9_9CAUD|nr:hypothetical protein [Vibrio phage vB_VibM_10AMN]WNO47423.1 hypothetical protein [Staphylococcus phage vB_VibM_10AMN12]